PPPRWRRGSSSEPAGRDRPRRPRDLSAGRPGPVPRGLRGGRGAHGAPAARGRAVGAGGAPAARRGARRPGRVGVSEEKDEREREHGTEGLVSTGELLEHSY